MNNQKTRFKNDKLFFLPIDVFRRVLSSDISEISKAQIFSNLCRLNTLSMIKQAGSGHVGSSFSAMEIASWVHLNEIDNDTGLYFSSKGHDVPGLYSILVGLEKIKFEEIHKLRLLNGLPGHPHVGFGGAITNTGSLGMGISKAKGIVHADRMRDKNRSIFVMLGDGELQEGQIWESLSTAVNEKMGSIVALVDHNKLQSDTYVCDVNDLGDIEAKFSSFGWHCQRADGHEIEQIRCAISNAKSEIETPSVIIFDTTKGQGVSFMEPNNISFGNLYPFHSGAPSDKDYYRALEEISIKLNEQMAELDLKPHSFIAINRASPSRPAGAEKLLPAYTKALMEAMRENDNIVVLDADLRLDTGLVEVHQAFPDRFIECGIAEQDMVSTAGTLALMGKIPIVHSFACFLSSRPNEQIYNNATEGSKIIYFGALAGLLPGGPGHSHQAVRDISSLGNIPGISVVEAADGRQLQKLFHWAVETNLTSTYIRAVTLPFEQHYPLQNFKVTPGHGRLLRHGGDMTLISYGPLMLNQTILASQTLATEGIEATVIDMPWLNMVDPKWLQNAVIPGKPLFVIENHYTAGGLGQTIATNILAMKNSLVSRQIIFGLNEVPACGGNDQVMKFHQLDAASIAMRVKQNLI